jgi:hypothetical protein
VAGHDVLAEPDAVLAYLLLLLFAFAMSWVGALIGLSSPSVEVAQSAGLMWLCRCPSRSTGGWLAGRNAREPDAEVLLVRGEHVGVRAQGRLGPFAVDGLDEPVADDAHAPVLGRA